MTRKLRVIYQAHKEAIQVHRTLKAWNNEIVSFDVAA